MKKQDFDITIFSRRFSLLLSETDENTYTLAEKLGLTPATISRYANGIMAPKLPTLYAIADIFGVNPVWLFGYDVPKEVAKSNNTLPSNIIPMPEMYKIPLIGTIACGQPILAEEHIEEYIDIPKHIRADFALTCKGDSMINARIFDGDVVYIRQQEQVENGEIAAVLIDTEATLKRLYLYPEKDMLILKAENPKYEDYIFVGSEIANVRILGKAVAFTSPIR